MSDDADAATPILIVQDADDPGPFMSIRTVCSRCRKTITSRQVDVRLAKLRGHAPMPDDAGARDALAWERHVARGCRLAQP